MGTGLLEAHPIGQAKIKRVARSRIKADYRNLYRFEEGLLYIDLGQLAVELPTVFAVVERLHTQGDPANEKVDAGRQQQNGRNDTKPREMTGAQPRKP